jgi:hypothetical protein
MEISEGLALLMTSEGRSDPYPTYAAIRRLARSHGSRTGW